MTWERKFLACAIVSFLAAHLCAKECYNNQCGQAKDDTEDQSLLQLHKAEDRSLLQTDASATKPTTVSSGTCSQPITTQAECLQIAEVTSDTNFKNKDGVSWGGDGDVSHAGAPSGCLLKAPLVPPGIPPRIYFNSLAGSATPCGTNDFDCVCAGSEDDPGKNENAEDRSLLQTDRSATKPITLSSGTCSEPITTEAECMQVGEVTSDTSIKNMDGVGWGGDVAHGDVPSGCLFVAPLVPPGVPPRIYFNSHAGSATPCGTHGFDCVCGGSEDDGDDGYDDYYYILDADGDATGGKGGGGTKTPEERAAAKAARKAAREAADAARKAAREAADAARKAAREAADAARKAAREAKTGKGENAADR